MSDEPTLCLLLLQELVVAIQGLIAQFEKQFSAVALQYLEGEKQREQHPLVAAVALGGWNVVTGTG